MLNVPKIANVQSTNETKTSPTGGEQYMQDTRMQM